MCAATSTYCKPKIHILILQYLSIRPLKYCTSMTIPYSTVRYSRQGDRQYHVPARPGTWYEIHFDSAEHNVLDEEPLNSAEYAQRSEPFRSNRGLGERRE